MIVNQILLMSLTRLVKYEYCHTESEELISMVNKTVFTQTMNSIIILLVSDYAIKSKFFGFDGVSGISFDFSISNTIVFIILEYVDAIYLLKQLLLKIKWSRNKSIKIFYS
jgi:hypothetical protein